MSCTGTNWTWTSFPVGTKTEPCRVQHLNSLCVYPGISRGCVSSRRHPGVVWRYGTAAAETVFGQLVPGEGRVAPGLGTDLVGRCRSVCLRSKHRLVIRGVGIWSSACNGQALVHGICEGLARPLGLDGTVLGSHSHRALVDHAATVHHGWRDGRRHQGAAGLRVIHLSLKIWWNHKQCNISNPKWHLL